jgi:hypothetical protein
MEMIKFGPEESMKMTEPLDTWLAAGLRDYAVPEAVGSSARVFKLAYKPLSGDYGDFPAIKIMRPDKVRYALPLFENEVRILDRMKDVPGVTPLMGLGFLKVEDGQWPAEIAPMTKSLQQQASASVVSGTAEILFPEEADSFLENLTSKVEEGWLAFMILPRRWEDNLYLRCDAGYTRGEYHQVFPVRDALKSALQITDIIQAAHERQIVYLDHKILHYYWNEPRQQVFVLDWNIGRLLNNGGSKDVYHFDLLQFSARALHHLMTGRQAPGTVKVGPNRPEEIQNAPEAYDPVWTYDDQKRLTQDEMEVLSQAVQGAYPDPQALSRDLKALYQHRQAKS